jgi:hypothetical protein
LIFNSFAFWAHRLFVGGLAQPLQSFKLTNGLLSPSPTSHTSSSFLNSGVNPTVSANGLTNGILWAPVQVGSTGTDVELRAYNATNLGTLLYSTNQVLSRDAINGLTHRTSATVANRRVYLPSSDLTDLQATLFVYGLLP